jgi:hypothetical protein
MKCEFCGELETEMIGIWKHIQYHVTLNEFDDKGRISLRQFLLLVQLFYGELPQASHIRGAIKDAEKKVDEAMKEMQLTA